MRKIVVIAGPTATGKTSLALEITKQLNGEIINADSRQVYKYFNIGTNKENHIEHSQINNLPVSKFEDGTLSYLFDFVEAQDEFSLSNYQKLAYESIEFVLNNNKIPIIVGGSGLYIDSIVKGYEIQESEPLKKIREILENKTLSEFYDLLAGKGFDVTTLNNSDKNNKRRLIRIYEKLESKSDITKTQNSIYNPIILYPKFDREELYSRINKRVDEMFELGLINEVQNLIDKGFRNTRPMQGIGYKEVVDFIDNKISKTECIEKVKQSHRRYARRQITWFEGEGRNYQFNKFDFKNIDQIIEFLKENLSV